VGGGQPPQGPGPCLCVQHRRVAQVPASDCQVQVPGAGALVRAAPAGPCTTAASWRPEGALVSGTRPRGRRRTPASAWRMGGGRWAVGGGRWAVGGGRRAAVGGWSGRWPGCCGGMCARPGGAGRVSCSCSGRPSSFRSGLSGSFSSAPTCSSRARSAGSAPPRSSLMALLGSRRTTKCVMLPSDRSAVSGSDAYLRGGGGGGGWQGGGRLPSGCALGLGLSWLGLGGPAQPSCRRPA
jgi:hypothetical protein